MRFRSSFPALVVLFSLACATNDAAAPRYVNETMGIASSFGDAWMVYTDRASAPEIAKPEFPPNKGPNESPLLLAKRKGSNAYGRVIVDPVPRDWSARTYFDVLHRSLGPKVDTLEVTASEADDAVRWSYREKGRQAGLVYLETVTVRAGYGIRIGFWSDGESMQDFRGEFEALMDGWRFRDEQGAWQSRWSGLSGRLTREGFEHIALAAPGRTSEGCAVGSHPLLYEVVGPKGRLHLFGSLQFGQPSFYPLPDVVEEAFAKSQTLVVEFDITNLELQREISERMQRSGQLPEGDHVRDHLEPATWQELEGAFAELAIPMRNFSGLKPWAIALVLSDLKRRSLGFLPRYGIDRHFLERAGPREIVSIETPADQIAAREALDGDLLLSFTLQGLAVAVAETEAVRRAWLCGDAAELEALFIDARGARVEGGDRVIEALIHDRSARMAAAARRRLTVPGEHFMVVGVAHLVGARGVPALLRERGFEVRSK